MHKLYRLTAITALSALGFVPQAFAEGLPGAPAPFDKGGVKLALISYISAGDFFQAYQAGAEAQAKALGVDLRVFPGRQDAAEQREQILQAINLGVQGIVVDHGLPESLTDVVQQALDKGIKVVAFDVNLDNPKIRRSSNRITSLQSSRSSRLSRTMAPRSTPATSMSRDLRRSIAATRSGTR